MNMPINFDYESRIIQRENLLIASAFANEELLRNLNLIDAIALGLHKLGQAVVTDRCYLFQNAWNDSMQQMVCNQRLEWTSEAAGPQIDNPALQNVPFSAVEEFMRPLVDGKQFQCVVRQLDEGQLKELLSMQDIKSLLVLPIHVESVFWGFVGFDDCQRERSWTDAEVSILASFAASIASAIIRKRIEDDLEKTRNEAIKANKAKSDFLANITHEIRTPLHGVIGYAEMLSNVAFPPQEQQHYDNLCNSARTLSKLITDILEISKIEAGVFELNSENCLLKPIIESALSTVGPMVATNHNRLEVELDLNIPDTVYLDATRLKQVLVNLLSNALKFTSRGKVLLQARCSDHTLDFVVEDNGIGMDEQQLQRLFEPFVQFDSSIAKKYQGSGLGLPIARHILSRLGADLHVSSRPDVGSRFWFSLPLDKIRPLAQTASTAGLNETMEPITTRTPVDILIVEDNALSMRLAVTMLQKIAPGIRIHQAESGKAALELVKKGLAPQLVLMDLQMPDMDGFETTRQLASISNAPCRIIALTATATDTVRQQCREVGMEDFLSKPFTRNQLRELLVRHVC